MPWLWLLVNNGLAEKGRGLGLMKHHADVFALFNLYDMTVKEVQIVFKDIL